MVLRKLTENEKKPESFEKKKKTTRKPMKTESSQEPKFDLQNLTKSWN